MPNIIIPRPGLWKPPAGSILDTGHPLAQNLLGAWLLNEGSGISVKNLVSGQIGKFNSEATVLWKNGQRGRAISFDGSASSWIEVDTTPSLNHSKYDVQIATIAAWIMPTGNPPFNTGGVFARGMSSNSGYSLDTTGSGNNFDMKISLNDNVSSDGLVTTDTPVPLNKWSHVVGQFNGNVLKVYVNGVFKVSKAQVAAVTASTVVPRIGGRNDSGNVSFNGHIDSVFIWKDMLGDGSIKRLYEEPYAMFRGPEVSRRYWVFGGVPTVPIVAPLTSPQQIIKRKRMIGT